jgi:hypothetical protein
MGFMMVPQLSLWPIPMQLVMSLQHSCERLLRSVHGLNELAQTVSYLSTCTGMASLVEPHFCGRAAASTPLEVVG